MTCALHGGRVFTAAGDDTAAEAVALSGDRIAAVGTDEEILGLVDADTRTVDLEGRALLPGFIDAHVHLSLCAITMGLMIDLRTPPCRSVADQLRRLSKEAREAPEGAWVVGQGNILQEHRLEDKRLVSRAELDSVSRRHPIAVRYGYHVTVLNTRALKAAGVERGTPDPPDATVVRDGLGEPTGLVREFYRYLPVPEHPLPVLKEALRRVIEGEFLARGVTTAYEITDGLDAVRAIAELWRDGESPLRVAAYVNVPTTVGIEALLGGEAFDEVERRGLECLGLKLFADGAGHEAALHEPYADMPDYRGKLNFADGELEELVRRAHASGRQIAIHAEGDRAQDQVLDVYERVLAEHPRPDHRHRIEHMGNLFGTRRRLKRAGAMGVLPVPNPGFIHAFADFEEDLFGPERTRRMYNLADLKRLGLPVPGNSDCAGAHPETIDPLNNVWCAVNRRTYLGKRLDPDQALSVTDALRMVTIDAAYAGHQETEKGSIEPGKLADLVVLSDDPLRVDPARLNELVVEQTWIGGEPVYVRKEGPVS